MERQPFSYSEFYSHHDITLRSHLESVSDKAKRLIEDTNFTGSEIAFYSGLLHDIGKLNPYYQEIFRCSVSGGENLQTQLEKKYPRQHSIFSAWAAEFLLQDVIVDRDDLQLALRIIAGHHSSLSKNLYSPDDKRTEEAKSKIEEYLPVFREKVKESVYFSQLNWNSCLKKYKRKISFQGQLNPSSTGIESFVRAGVLYSALLQSDRGSFESWSSPRFDITFDTRKLVSEASELATLRSEFQKAILNTHNSQDRMVAIRAPTGIGKTKAFLDIVSRYADLERVIYFSPLLALTEDMESKIRDIVSEDSAARDDILIYNHLFTGSISSSKNGEDSPPFPEKYNFLYESFNSKMIITTTQRLLMTIYSNYVSDKMKLISFKNSLLILDEVQVIPKFILSNLISVLKVICEKMNSKVLLISATIPKDVQQSGIRILDVPAEINERYLARTSKSISFKRYDVYASLLEEVIGSEEKRILLMANTRRRAKTLFEEMTSNYDSGRNVYYLSSGIRKSSRTELIKRLKSDRSDRFILISTQVVEAGVDIDFDRIFREAAPLDSVIQVMGRLNRECRNASGKLNIFQKEDTPTPYSEIEYRESIKLLQNITNSKDLYELLPKYYDIVNEKDKSSRNRSSDLNSKMQALEFEGVWQCVKDFLSDEPESTVFVPETEEEAEELREAIQKCDRKSSFRQVFKKFAGLGASFPVAREKELMGLFDEECMERYILIPKRGKLREVYDEAVGLDKWLKK